MYQKFNVNGPIQNYLADPVQDCIAGNFFNGHDNPLRYDIGRCSTFMGQRCSKQWDGYCDLYLKERMDADFVGKAANEFLIKALDAQFCTVNKSLPGSEQTCFTKCEQMDPLAPDSAMICQTEGNFIYRNTDKLYNIDTQYPSTGRLSTPSPIRIAECPKVCNLLTEDKLTDDNRVLNECIDRGIGADILVNIAENAISQNVKITNSRFNRFIQSFVLKSSNSLTPGFASLGASPMLSTVKRNLPASNPTIPTKSTIMLGNDALFGPQMLTKDNEYESVPEEEALSVQTQPKEQPKPRFVGMNLDKEAEKQSTPTVAPTPTKDEGKKKEPYASVSAPPQSKVVKKSPKLLLLYILLCICILTLIYVFFFTK